MLAPGSDVVDAILVEIFDLVPLEKEKQKVRGSS